MQKVEYVGTSIDQKLNHAWNCSNIKVAYRDSILQLKARVETKNIGTNSSLNSKTNCPYMGVRKSEDGVVPSQSVVVGEESTREQVEVLFMKWLMLLQLSAQRKTCHSADYYKNFQAKRNLNKTK